MNRVTGWISIKLGGVYHNLYFSDHGWMAADIVQYIDEILKAEDRQIAILKLLGYTMQVEKKTPARKADHWVEVDLENHVLTTNSDLLRKAVDRLPAAPDDPYSPIALRRIHEVLDRYDFTVKFKR